jgi:hypothetical protein
MQSCKYILIFAFAFALGAAVLFAVGIAFNELNAPIAKTNNTRTIAVHATLKRHNNNNNNNNHTVTTTASARPPIVHKQFPWTGSNAKLVEVQKDGTYYYYTIMGKILREVKADWLTVKGNEPINDTIVALIYENIKTRPDWTETEYFPISKATVRKIFIDKKGFKIDRTRFGGQPRQEIKAWKHVEPEQSDYD